MEPWSIVKIVMFAIGALVVLDKTPGIDILENEKADYKALVKCEAKYEGLGRKHKETEAELKGVRKDLKDERKKSSRYEEKAKKLEEMLEQEIKDSFSDLAGDNRRRDGLRGWKDRGAWKKIFP